MLKLTSVVMVFTLTSTNAMWVPEKRQEPEKTTASKPTTTTTIKKPTATSVNKESTTQKKESSTKKESGTKSSSEKSKSSQKPESTGGGGGGASLPPTTTSTSSSSSAGLPSSTSASAESPASSSSAGIIGGIIAAVAVLIIGVGAFFIIRKKKARRNLRAQSMKPDPFTMGYGNSDPKPLDNNFPPAQPYKTQANNSFDNYEVAPITNTITNQQQQQQQYQPQLSPAPPAPAAPATTPIATQYQQKSIGSFTVIATYIPTLSDELEIETGDQIDLIVEYDDGWCQGVNLSKGNTKGVFPRHCIDYATAPSNHANNNDIERSKRVSSMYQP
ncbi:hypothetical protein HPULCUR_009801 [Helicostylum pulchrum]|uniref:SH3 domain-containing protein n=1 Tax=Helicostylum pulchrum TaxID=562976 RepID=A0ABP9YBH9_9FUNG